MAPVTAVSATGSPIPAVSEELREALEGMLDRRPVETIAERLLSAGTYRGYGYDRVPVIRALGEVERAAGPEGAAAWLRLLLVHLADSLETRLADARVPPSVSELVRAEGRRIAAQAGSQPDRFYSLANDAFLKDLGIVLLTLLPCGAELVQVRDGVPRSILMRGGMRQMLRGLRYFGLRTRGFRPFYSLHLDPRRLEEFTPEGWDRTYLRIAELLRLNPEVKGVFGTAWFYDPEVESVSPHLGYLRRRRVENGAVGFLYGATREAAANALARSRTRRRLYEEGKYVPVSYYLVWARDDLLRWAERCAEGAENALA